MPTITTVDATWDTGVTLDASELRRADTAMFAGDGSANGVRGGIVYHGSTSLAVSVNGSDQVTVQAGAAVIPAATGLGAYRCALSAATSAVGIAARNATNPRIDLVVMQATGAGVTVKTIEGTPGASPSAPALPAQHIELARLTVPAVGGGAVTVDSTWRTFATGLGGTLYVPTAARLPGSGAGPRQKAIALDTGLEHVYTGTGWASTGETNPDGSWQTWTPSANGLPATAIFGRWRTVGKTVQARGKLAVTGAAGAEFQLFLPVEARSDIPFGNGGVPLGTATAHDPGATAALGVCVLGNSNRNAVSIYSTHAMNQAWGVSAPFTWASGDEVAFSVEYEKA